MPDDKPTYGKIIGTAPDGGFRYQPVLRGADGSFVPFMAPLGVAFEANDGPVTMGAVVEIHGDRFTFAMPAESPATDDEAARIAEHFRQSGHSRLP